jgi:hypothetical protein
MDATMTTSRGLSRNHPSITPPLDVGFAYLDGSRDLIGLNKRLMHTSKNERFCRFSQDSREI